MTRLFDLRRSYPGSLGFGVPPKGFLFLIDEGGNYLTDDDGVFLIVPEVGV